MLDNNIYKDPVTRIVNNTFKVRGLSWVFGCEYISTGSIGFIETDGIPSICFNVVVVVATLALVDQ